MWWSGIAAHEHEVVADPVGNLEAEHVGVEVHGLGEVGREIGDMAELDDGDALGGLLVGERVPCREQLDLGALRVGEFQHVGDAGRRIVAALAANAVLGQIAFAASPRSVSGAISNDSLRQPTLDCRAAARPRDDRDCSPETPVLVLGRDHQPDDVRVVIGQPVDVLCLKDGVSNSAGLDHDISSTAS